MKTTVIELYGGAGCGKSTTAAGLFYQMKRLGLDVELVREYVKELVWSGETLKASDQLNYFKAQSRRESVLYGKVKYIITDSPILLGPVYEKFYTGTCPILNITNNFIRESGLKRVRLNLARTKAYVESGRNETTGQVKEVDILVKTLVTSWGYDLIDINVKDDEKVGACFAEVIKAEGGLL